MAPLLTFVSANSYIYDCVNVDHSILMHMPIYALCIHNGTDKLDINQFCLLLPLVMYFSLFKC